MALSKRRVWMELYLIYKCAWVNYVGALYIIYRISEVRKHPSYNLNLKVVVSVKRNSDWTNGGHINLISTPNAIPAKSK